MNAEQLSQGCGDTEITCNCIKRCDSSCLRDGCDSGTASNLFYPQTAKQHLSPEGLLHFPIISAHEEYGCEMKYSTLLSDLFAAYPAVSPRQFKDRSSPFRTCPLGVRQPICFPPAETGPVCLKHFNTFYLKVFSMQNF